MLIIPSSSSVGVDWCQSVTIVGDNIRESDEMFQVLATPVNAKDSIIGPDTVTVTIVDDGDGKPQLASCWQLTIIRDNVNLLDKMSFSWSVWMTKEF